MFTNTERLALAGFLAGYSGLTRQAYELDLRQYASWCHQHHLRLFQARRPDIECFARDLLAFNGLRVSEATDANIENLGETDPDQRTLGDRAARRTCGWITFSDWRWSSPGVICRGHMVRTHPPAVRRRHR